MTDYQSVDDYLAAQPMPARSVLERVRATIREALPGATEGISYQIPVYKLDGVMVLYFAGFQRHYSIYPATPRIVGALEKDLAGWTNGGTSFAVRQADGCPRFPPDVRRTVDSSPMARANEPETPIIDRGAILRLSSPDAGSRAAPPPRRTARRRASGPRRPRSRHSPSRRSPGSGSPRPVARPRR
jgi:uncharacterized protein YdhG (YjbR/CyaY superfamily)